MTGPSLMHEIWHSEPLHWDNPLGWDGMGRERVGISGQGDTCTPVADSCQCMAKPRQYCKVISLQLK